MKLHFLSAVISTSIAIIGVFSGSSQWFKVSLIFLAIASGVFSFYLSYQSNKDTDLMKHLLKNLTRSLDPPDYLESIVMKKVVSQLNKQGLGYCQVQSYTNSDLTFLCYEKDEISGQQTSTGYLVIYKEELVELSMHSDKELNERLKEIINEKWAYDETDPDSIREHDFFEKLVHIIRRYVSRYIDFDGLGNDIVADDNGKKYLFIKTLHRDEGRNIKPLVMTIPMEKINEALKHSRVIAGGLIANLIGNKYGLKGESRDL